MASISSYLSSFTKSFCVFLLPHFLLKLLKISLQSTRSSLNIGYNTLCLNHKISEGKVNVGAHDLMSYLNSKFQQSHFDSVTILMHPSHSFGSHRASFCAVTDQCLPPCSVSFKINMEKQCRWCPD